MILPVTAMLLCGVAQFAVIAINAIMVKYAAFAVARSAISYVEPWKSEQSAQRADYIIKKMITDLNDISINTNDVVRFRVPDDIRDAELIITDKKFVNSEYIHKKIILKYDLELHIPFANKFFAMLYNGKKNGRYYFPITASAVMNSGVKK